MISYIIPTRNRGEQLQRTLSALDRLGDHLSVGGAEVVIVDNASDEPVSVPCHLPRGLKTRIIRLDENKGAAARNIGADHADERSDWLVMLDDDSAPMDSGLEIAIRRAPDYAAAISADVFLGDAPDAIRRREDGGLPEVFVGCGVAIRREAFHRAGGYDESFGFYAEEYDLSAKLLLAGHRVVFSPIFRVLHRKVETGRDMDLIARRLVRNNAWVCQRYAPESALAEEQRRIDERCRWIAGREGAMTGYEAGCAERDETVENETRTPMDDDLWDRFTGLAAARDALDRRIPERANTAELIAEGKNAHVVRRVLEEMDIRVVESGGDVRVIGTMSPGPMLDALERAGDGAPVIAPWLSAKKSSLFGEAAA